MSQCLSERSLHHCTCTFLACDKRGNCCRCVIYHRDRGELPGCFFSVSAERSYDRSLARLIKDRDLI